MNVMSDSGESPIGEVVVQAANERNRNHILTLVFTKFANVAVAKGHP